ncbi:uncharacterized protein LOC110855907 isoform X2 [Folsomia candida]|uniref:uncharacterized protein LOC110855907 isoform X2 n=1 Tax=Folsomia candida TaxID=158441 RepID=UPI000B90860B|nr:uncharacterized protein LOC110855907 isoform X2 [Folsomia candida]
MRCRFCVSLRSAVFFGASINIFLGAIHFFYFMMQMFLYFRYLRRPEQTSLTWVSFFTLLMGAIYFPLGCLIFRGVEKERLNLIRFPMWIFFLCKVTELSLKVYHEWALIHPDRRVGLDVRIYQTIDVAAATVYFLVLFVYAKRLAQGRGEGSDNYYKASEVDDADLSLQRRKAKLLPQ